MTMQGRGNARPRDSPATGAALSCWSGGRRCFLQITQSSDGPFEQPVHQQIVSARTRGELTKNTTSSQLPSLEIFS